MKIDYCHSLLNYKRFETLEVEIGSVLFGGNHPVRVQSMTNTDTKNIDESIEQSKRIFDAGADLVRLTIPSVKDIDSLRLIKSGLVPK